MLAAAAVEPPLTSALSTWFPAAAREDLAAPPFSAISTSTCYVSKCCKNFLLNYRVTNLFGYILPLAKNWYIPASCQGSKASVQIGHPVLPHSPCLSYASLCLSLLLTALNLSHHIFGDGDHLVIRSHATFPIAIFFPHPLLMMG